VGETRTDRTEVSIALNTGRRGGPEPTDITLEAFGRPIPDA
jgi:hypothetical protein